MQNIFNLHIKQRCHKVEQNIGSPYLIAKNTTNDYKLIVLLSVPSGEDVCQLVQVLIELRLQLVEHPRGVLLQLLPSHRVVGLLQLDAGLLDVVHEDAGRGLVADVVGEVLETGGEFGDG